MESPDEKTPRQRVVIYLDPKVVRRLKLKRGETDRSMGHIVEEALVWHLDKIQPRIGA